MNTEKHSLAFVFGDKPLRTTSAENGTPLFCGKDVCGILEIAKPDTSLALLDADERVPHTVGDALGRPQAMTFITESGLWSLVMRSRKPAAKAFRKWVTGEVIPSIMRTGRYEAPAAAALPQLSDDELADRVVASLKARKLLAKSVGIKEGVQNARGWAWIHGDWLYAKPNTRHPDFRAAYDELRNAGFNWSDKHKRWDCIATPFSREIVRKLFSDNQ